MIQPSIMGTVKAHPRSLARARYEGGATAAELSILCYREIMRLFKEGRVPFDVARNAVRLASDELEERVLERSVTWAPHPERAQLFEPYSSPYMIHFSENDPGS